MRRYSTDKDLNKFANECASDGWNISTSGRDHLKWEHPSGAKFFSSQTPSCQFAWKKVRSDMRRALKAAGIGTDAYDQMKFRKRREKIERREERMQETLTHKLSISTQPKANLPSIHKEVLNSQLAKRKMLELVASGKTPEDAATVVMSVFDVKTGFGKSVGRETMIKMASTPFSRRGKGKKTLKAMKETRPRVVDEKPVQTKSAKEPPRQIPVSDSEIDSTLIHVRSILTLPFEKQKKIEIIFDLLDKLL